MVGVRGCLELRAQRAARGIAKGSVTGQPPSVTAHRRRLEAVGTESARYLGRYVPREWVPRGGSLPPHRVHRAVWGALTATRSNRCPCLECDDR